MRNVLAILFIMSLVAAAPTTQPLTDITIDGSRIRHGETRTYTWKHIKQSGSNRQEKDYGTFVASNAVTKAGIVEMRDVATVGDKSVTMVFDRVLAYSIEDLLRPTRGTIDMTVAPPGDEKQSKRIFELENGRMKTIDPSGAESDEAADFGKGILTFNAMLRIAPQLPRTQGTKISFGSYVEPFLFRRHEPEGGTPAVLITCTGEQDWQNHRCAVFTLEIPAGKEEFWVDVDRNLVVRFIEVLPRAGESMEATIKD